jgi:cytochrome c peroxidase
MRLLLAFLGACSGAPTTARQTEELGALLFNDTSLSEPAGQSCADCHTPRAKFTDPERDRTTSLGAVDGRAGSRNTPTAMYARFIPPLRLDAASHEYSGGLFWDGRASSLEEQAPGPLLNPLEMNNADEAAVVAKLRAAPYAQQFRTVFGPTALDDVSGAFKKAMQAIAAYERSAAFSPFNSNYDRWLAGHATLTAEEQRGLAIFEDPARGNCASCHPSPMFTNYSYVNLGVPRYGNNPFYQMPPALNPDGGAYVDHGLSSTVGDRAQDGKFRVPTLRNIARTAPYGHNGYFDNLPFIIDFHNSRDGKPLYIDAWPAPEVPATVDKRVGRLGLNQQDILDLTAFLRTLTDSN